VTSRALIARFALLALVGLGLLLSACSLPPRGERAKAAAEPRKLIVFAASSLTEAFDDLAARFEAGHPGVEVRASYAGSQVLHTQLEHGATADVFASADAGHIDALARSGLVVSSEPFASNELVVVFPSGSDVARTAADLPAARRIVLGAESVPVGRYTDRFLARADDVFGAGYRDAVLRHVVSREPNVRLVLAKVTLGEADAALVYHTDALAARGSVRVAPLPAGARVRAELFAGALRDAPEPALARAFLATLRGQEGREVLTSHGFGPAPVRDMTRGRASAPLRGTR
jgi:molybdate transport system substrate-binding protein